MKYLVAVAMSAAILAPARSADRYDRKLEEQVLRIVAENIGDIRGTLSYDKVMVFTAVDRTGSPSFQALRTLQATGEPHFQVIE
jgi:hypothetical protein